jgi:hypothetical protein
MKTKTNKTTTTTHSETPFEDMLAEYHDMVVNGTECVDASIMGANIGDVLEAYEKAIVSLQTKQAMLETHLVELALEIKILRGRPTQTIAPTKLRVPTFGVDSVPTSAPKETTPRRKVQDKRVKLNKTPRETTVRAGMVDSNFAAALVQARDKIIANTRNPKTMPYNDKLNVLIENDPRVFLVGQDSGAFRFAYKNANIKYSDAALMLAEALDDAGWVNPTIK